MEVKDKNIQEPKEKKGGCCGCLTVLILSFVFFNPFTLIMIRPLLSPKPTEPSIKYGEFPFELVYKLDGETHVISDSIVCEYEGTEALETERIRVWKAYIKSTGDNKLGRIDVSSYNKYMDWISGFYNFGSINESGEYELGYIPGADGLYDITEEQLLFTELYYDIGNGGYLMGDDYYSDYPEPAFDNVEFSSLRSDEIIIYGSMSVENAYELFGFEFISWECAPPIENSFSE